MHAVFHVAPLSSRSTMHCCNSRHARCVPPCTVAVLVMMLCSTMYRCSFLVMHAMFHNARLSSRHARCVPRSTVEFSFHNALLQFSSCTLCSTIHSCSSRHARCVPQCAVSVLIMHAVFHNAPLQFSSCTLYSSIHGCCSRHTHCVPLCTAAVVVITLCSTMNA